MIHHLAGKLTRVSAHIQGFVDAVQSKRHVPIHDGIHQLHSRFAGSSPKYRLGYLNGDSIPGGCQLVQQ